MTKEEIFKYMINVLRPEDLRRKMEYTYYDALSEITTALEDTELTILGMGMYSLVVEHPKYPNRVFKVSTSRWDGFRTYAKYCQANKGAPFIPVIHSAHEQGNFGWYELDKYYPIVKPSKGYEDFINSKSEDLYSYAHAGQYAKNEGVLEGTPEQLAIYALTKNITEEFEKLFTIDIHTGNIMVDSNGEVLITDPLGGDLRREIPVTENDPTFD